MADVHKYFINFHDSIKFDDENETLREKREIILEKLKNNISKDDKGYDTFNQGSYAMSTGVKPVDGDYDIDVGIKFRMSKDEAEPLAAKDWVFKALDGHTKSVKIKNPCVTVTYQEGGEPAYHLDLAIYAAGNEDGKVYLAKGKPDSKPENKKWEASSPQELLDAIRGYFSILDDRAQFRRVIRYLKRWKDIKYSDSGNSKPTGIALTCTAYHWLSPNKTLVDVTANKYEYNDLKCLVDFVSSVIGKFYQVWDQDSGKSFYRLAVQLPVAPYSDLYEKMTNKQMEKFKEKLESLQAVLKAADNEVDPVEACKMLKVELGDDFPVPPPEDTAKAKSVAITTISSSAN